MGTTETTEFHDPSFFAGREEAGGVESRKS